MIEKQNFDKTITAQSFAPTELCGTEFDNCIFIDCNFSNCILSDIDFIDCAFENCNFTMAKTINTGLKDVKFKGSKLVGLDFEVCNNFLFEVNFNNCQLDYALFSKKNLRKTVFHKCSVKEAEFMGSNLSEASFAGCDLDGSHFEQCNLEKTDFRMAINITINPENNRMKKALFSLDGLPGLLTKYHLDISQ